MPDIFISYRREDTSGYAGRIYDQLSTHFGKDHVFMDVADLEPGSDFVETIEKKVGTCDALLALIGKNWLTIKDEQNQVRLTRPGDFVSVEISAALKRNIEVIPVLVGGAKMPLQRELPESLQLLYRRQALEISDVHFPRDVDDLIQALKRPAGTLVPGSSKWAQPAIFGICALAIGLGFCKRRGTRSHQWKRPPLSSFRLSLSRQRTSAATGWPWSRRKVSPTRSTSRSKSWATSYSVRRSIPPAKPVS